MTSIKQQHQAIIQLDTCLVGHASATRRYLMLHGCTLLQTTDELGAERFMLAEGPSPE